MGRAAGLEPATSAFFWQRSDQLSYTRSSTVELKHRLPQARRQPLYGAACACTEKRCLSATLASWRSVPVACLIVSFQGLAIMTGRLQR